jgi:alpha-2-macroglobulin
LQFAIYDWTVERNLNRFFILAIATDFKSNRIILLRFNNSIIGHFCKFAMNIKFPVCSLVLFSIWINLFAPFVSAQNPAPTLPQQKFGLHFRLSEAPKVQPTATPVSIVPNIEKLSQTEADAILQRLPELPKETETVDFKMRSETIKPPRPGNIIPLKFSPNEKRNPPIAPTKKALEITRFSPESDVSFVSDLRVTFSQPMIAVSSQTIASESVPVKITPEVKGKWRWLGTNTLIFDAETRFPMATNYSVTIPHGTKSVAGGVLAKDFSRTFTTPPPKVEKFLPQDFGGVYRDNSVITVKFNQEVDAESVLSKIVVSANGKELPTKLLARDYAKYEGTPPQWMTFQTVEPLPKEAEIKVSFGKGIPSKEGAAVSETEKNFSFKTAGELKVIGTICGYRQPNTTQCAPSDEVRLRFNTSFDPATFDKSLVKIEPPIENAEIHAGGTEILIRGRKKSHTAYKVTLAPEILDYFKEKIGNEVSATFKVTNERPQILPQGVNFVTLDPQAKPVFSIYTRNHLNFKVKVYSVLIADFPNFGKFLDDFHNNRLTSLTPNFGKLIFEKTVETKAEIDALMENGIDLSEALPNKFGHAVVIAEPTTPPIQERLYQIYNRPIVAWVQSTNIGINSFIDYEKLVTFATDLQTGKPLVKAQTALHGYQFLLTSLTDENGLATFSQPELFSGSNLVVKNGNDTAILHDNLVDWRNYKRAGSMRWFVFDDRKMYRPNEEVSLKGYLRNVTGGTLTDLAEIGDKPKQITYVWKDSWNVEISKGTVELNQFGAFDLKLKLPGNANLGSHRLEFWTREVQPNYPEFSHNFQVQEFRRPEFEVNIEAETPAPYFVGNSATIYAQAKYFTGGFLSDSNIDWHVSAFQTTYSPPGHDGFTFGSFVPWWRRTTENSPRDSFPPQNLKGTIDADGKHRINLDFVSANPARPYLMRTTAVTQDVNRQAIADNKSFLIHPSNLYVGLRSAKTFVKQNEPLKIEAIATDIDGKIVKDAPMTIKAELKNWRVSQEVTVDTQTCQIKSAAEAVSCEFIAKEGGTFKITATVLDEKERPNTSEITVWVAGGTSVPKRNVERETAEMIPDKKEYAPGETAEILLNAPFYPAEGVMTLERNGILKTERFSLNEPSKVLQIPVEEGYLPNFHVKVDLVGAANRTNDKGEIDMSLPKRPAFAAGELNLNVSKASRKLNVAVEPIDRMLEPSGKTSVNIEVKDHLGKASANTEVALVAVDESVLSLTNYKIQNPLEVFYQPIWANVAHNNSRQRVILGNSADLILAEQLALTTTHRRSAYLTGSISSDGFNQLQRGASPNDFVTQFWAGRRNANDNREQDAPSQRPQINLRRNFDAIAIFSPSVKTNENGRASINLKLPDNLSRYRITAVAVTKSKQFGLGESNVTAKQSLQVRPSAPRFLNFGDKAELPVVLENMTSAPISVSVAIRSNNADLTDGNGRKVTVPANDRVEVRFPVAARKAGIALFQVAATGGNFTDAAEVFLPVYTPATSETFATYGTTEANGAILQKINAPKDVYADFGGLEITSSSTQLQELTDAFIYLQNYEFECTEQISSRMLSVAALRDVLMAFNAKGLPSKEAIEAKMQSDIARLQKLHHGDGGFSFWRNDDASIPYLSVHVAHALARAKAKGYKIPDYVIIRSLDYLKNIEAKLPETYSQESRWAIAAYALYVRDLLGDKDSAKAKKLLSEVGLEKLSAESIGWILSVLANDKYSLTEIENIKHHLLNRVTETAGTAHFVTDYRDGEFVLLSSARRADAVILEAILKVGSEELGVRSEETLVPKIVRGLLANRVKGRWQSTQENAFVLLALDEYFRKYEKATPNFVAKIWLGNSFAGEQKFAGRSTDSNSINVPMSYLQSNKGEQNLILDKQGEGRLYYRIGLNYATKNLKLAAADYGFAVSRQYEAIDSADDVKQNADGSWTIRAGARVRVNVQMVAPTRRYHVALVDNLPAGFEIVNPGLATSGNSFLKYSDELRRRSFWFNHQNFRDNRAEAFAMLLREGVWNYSYLARATTPGNFVVPPAKAEEMYMPETFGRSKTDLVKVE